MFLNNPMQKHLIRANCMLRSLRCRFKDTQEKIVYVLFITLGLLQFIDAHSTLVSIGKRQELNRMILSAANLVGLEWSVVIFKIIDLIVVGILFFCWKRGKAIFATHFFVCLAFLITTYTLVIINNYTG